MTEREEIEKAIDHLESQRETLGDATVDRALAGLRRQLSELEEKKGEKKSRAPAAQTAGERRIVTILFCDVAGSTAMAESMDPEAWTEIMNTAFEYLIEPVERYGGTIARLMGDAILAFFGAPAAHEDDPQRAILAGLAILENIRPFREQLQQEQGLDFNVRVGINTGLAVVGDVGSQAVGEYTAMGDAVNLAARMEQTAAPGTVQVAQDTYTLVAPLFDFESLGRISVKGKNKAINAFRVLRRKTDPGQQRGLTGHGLSSPLIGRESELAVAKEALSRLSNGQGGILFIFGEAGIGKTRLLAELRDSRVGAVRESHLLKSSQSELEDGMYGRVSNPPVQHIRWLEGHTLSYGQTISYWPFQEMLRQEVGIIEEDTEAKAWEKLEARIGELFPEETADILPYLASLLTLPIKDEYEDRVKYLDGEAMGRQVYRVVRRFFRRLAQQNPLMLVFEDLHWADASSVGLLEHLLPLAAQAPILICGLSRSEQAATAMRLKETAEAQYENLFTLISLAPLTSENSGQLVHRLLEIDGLSNRVREMIINKADGNPFFLEEIVRDLIESEALALEPSTGRWRATKQIESVAVPDSIQALLVARIDRLNDKLKGVVRWAAVIGRSFLYRVVNAVLEEDPKLDRQLEALTRIELIREKQRIPELEYIFKHALAQEAAYDSILLQEKRKMHARVGRVIETLMADRLDEFYGFLAYHFSAAEEWEQAQVYLLKAGDQASSMAADAEALAHYHEAMKAYAHARGEDWDPVERAQLERKIGEALFRLGEHDEARAYLERALSYLGKSLPATRWGIRLATFRALLIQVGHSFLPKLFVGQMRDTQEVSIEEYILTSYAMGWIDALADVDRYLLVTLRALNTCEKVGYAYGSAYLSASLGQGADVLGLFKIAESYYRRSAAYGEKISPYRPVFDLTAGWAIHSNMLGDINKMVENAYRAAEIGWNEGNLRGWGFGMVQVAMGRWMAGRLEEGVEISLDILNEAEESSDLQVACWGLLPLGLCQRRLGFLPEAIKSHQRAVILAEALPDYLTQAGTGGFLGRTYIAQGEWDKGLDFLKTAERVSIEEGGNLPGYAYIGNGLAEAYLLKAEVTEGKDRKVWLKKARIVCRKTFKEAKRFRGTLPEASMFQGRYEWLSGNYKNAQKWWSKALSQAEEFGLPYEKGMIYLEIGRRLNDRHHLEQAVSNLEAIGAAFDLEVAREAIQDQIANHESLTRQ